MFDSGLIRRCLNVDARRALAMAWLRACTLLAFPLLSSSPAAFAQGTTPSTAAGPGGYPANGRVTRARLASQGFTPRPMSPEALRNFIRDETAKFGELIRANAITLD